MKIKQETFSHKMRSGKLICYNLLRTRKNYVFLIFFLIVLFSTESVFAQTDSTNKVKVDSPKKEEENLNVFQQWIKWNNPGSLALNHLTRQAEVYYKIRDKQIDKLKTKNDWLKRQQ